MKKKILLTVIALVLALVCLTACNKFESALKNVTSLLDVKYSKIALHVTTTTNGFELKGVYTFTFEKDKTTVDYSFDKLNELSLDGNNEEEYISTVTGTAVVKDGVIVEGDTSLELPQEINLQRMTFRSTYFKNYTITSSKFEADVSNPKGFTGNKELKCSNMHLKILCRKDALSQIAITYLSEGGSKVKITYVFTK